MNKALLIALSVIGAVGFILSCVLFISGICFGEWGRVILYFVTACVCAEMSVISLMKLFPNNKDKA